MKSSTSAQRIDERRLKDVERKERNFIARFVIAQWFACIKYELRSLADRRSLS